MYCKSSMRRQFVGLPNMGKMKEKLQQLIKEHVGCQSSVAALAGKLMDVQRYIDQNYINRESGLEEGLPNYP
jgi:hypothetical protein